MIIKRSLGLIVFILFSISFIDAAVTEQTIEDAIVRKYGKPAMLAFASSKYLKTKSLETRTLAERATLKQVDDLTVRDVSIVEAFAIYRFINALKHMSQLAPATKAQIIRELVVKCRQELNIQLSSSTYLDQNYNNNNFNASPLGLRLSPAEREAQIARDQAEIAELNLQLAEKKRQAAQRVAQAIY